MIFWNLPLKRKTGKENQRLKQTYRFDITPQSHLRVNQGDSIFFRIPRDQLHPPGLKRLLRLERSNKYADDLRTLARINKFTVPPQGAFFKFYFPCPKSWSKKKKRQYHGMAMTSKPDLDNCIKKILDSLCIEDKQVAHFQATKQWVYADQGWIDIEVDNYIFPSVPMVTGLK